MKYELIDHTADFGFRFNSPTLPDLFIDGALILSELLIDVGSRKPKTLSIFISIDGDDYVDLMVKWLGEMLHLFDCEHIAMKKVEIKSLTTDNISAQVLAFRIDLDNDKFVNDIEAVTYHQAMVKKIKGGWMSQLICDM